MTRSPSAGSSSYTRSTSSVSDYSNSQTDVYTSSSTLARADVTSVERPIDTTDGPEINEVCTWPVHYFSFVRFGHEFVIFKVPNKPLPMSSRLRDTFTKMWVVVSL